jgi:tRNA (guanine-N7-)-methyltransferase
VSPAAQDAAAHVPGSAPQLARTRSFSRRGGRMPQGHRTAYDAFAQRYVVSVPRAPAGVTTVHADARLEPSVVFGRRAPLVVEVGSGSGDALRAGAQARPDWDFLAVEVWRPGIAQTLARMADAPLPNVRFVEADAAQALATLLEPGAAHEVWTFFPDPWPKARHHKRRLIQPSFVDTVHRLLEPGGQWRIATDWVDYADSLRALLDADPRWTLTSTERAPLRPRTRFELKGVAAGRQIVDVTYRS